MLTAALGVLVFVLSIPLQTGAPAHAAAAGPPTASPLNGDFGATPDQHHDHGAALLRDGKLPDMDALLKDFRGQAQAYPAAGSFCGWFLGAHGLEAFRRLYPVSDLPAAAMGVVKKDWAAVDAEWRAFLGGRGVDGGAGAGGAGAGESGGAEGSDGATGSGGG